MTWTLVEPIVRRAARAVLIDDDARLVTIRRTRPGSAPYWTTPGGGIEPGDASREAALERELLEELGATAVVGQQLTLVTSPAEGGQSVQYFFAARLVGLDAASRSVEEHTDAARGGYEVDRIPLDQLAGYDLRPTKIRDFIVENRAALLADLPPKAPSSQVGRPCRTQPPSTASVRLVMNPAKACSSPSRHAGRRAHRNGKSWLRGWARAR